MGEHTGVCSSVLGGSVFDFGNKMKARRVPQALREGHAWYCSSAKLPEALGWDKEETGSSKKSRSRALGPSPSLPIPSLWVEVLMLLFLTISSLRGLKSLFLFGAV